MKAGTLIAIAILACYVALEAYTIRKASERMEPAYIHNLLIEAQTASQLCSASVLELESRFGRTLERATASYREDLSANNTGLSVQAIDDQIAEQTAVARATVTEAVDTEGCSTAGMKAHFQRYRIYARKSR